MNKFFKAIAILTSCTAIAAVGGLMACDNEENKESTSGSTYSDSIDSSVEESNSTAETSVDLTDANGLEYELSSDKTSYIVAGYSGDSSEVVIPDTYNSLPVTAIKTEAFKGNTAITSVTIPDSVVEIGKAAFSGCLNLRSVSLENTEGWYKTTEEGATSGEELSSNEKTNEMILAVKLIAEEEYWWYNTSSVSADSSTDNSTEERTTELEYELSDDKDYYIVYSVKYFNENDTEIVIPSEYNGLPVKEIERSAFANCATITSVTIPNSVTTIGSGTFGGCSSLTSVVFENTEGWYVAGREDATIDSMYVFEILSSEDVADSSLMATYLTDMYKYCNKWWYNTNV